METPRDDQLAADLRALRPTPHPEFAEELDKRAAAGFPRRSRRFLKGPPDLFTAMRNKGPAHLGRRLLPAAGVAIIAIAIGGAVISSRDDEQSPPDMGFLSLTEAPKSDWGSVTQEVEEAAPERTAPSESAAPSSSAGAEASQPAIRANLDGSAPRANASIQPKNRAVERNAELVLGADPADVAEDASKVFEAVHAHDGIVLESSTREGEAGLAGARFELLIPSGKLGDALAALSAIDEVRTRHEATNDITAPTVTTGEMLQDSKARVDSLLAQLADAETESEREAVEAELRQERRHRARLRAQLQHLERRADFSRVLVRIETGDSEQPADEGAWGIGDAFDASGKILVAVAAAAVVSLAILGPLALIALLAWLAHRVWVRRERRRVLS